MKKPLEFWQFLFLIFGIPTIIVSIVALADGFPKKTDNCVYECMEAGVGDNAICTWECKYRGH